MKKNTFKKITVISISTKELERFEAFASSAIGCREQKPICDPMTCDEIGCLSVKIYE